MNLTIDPHRTDLFCRRHRSEMLKIDSGTCSKISLPGFYPDSRRKEALGTQVLLSVCNGTEHRDPQVMTGVHSILT